MRIRPKYDTEVQRIYPFGVTSRSLGESGVYRLKTFERFWFFWVLERVYYYSSRGRAHQHSREFRRRDQALRPEPHPKPPEHPSWRIRASRNGMSLKADCPCGWKASEEAGNLQHLIYHCGLHSLSLIHKKVLEKRRHTDC